MEFGKVIRKTEEVGKPAEVTSEATTGTPEEVLSSVTEIDEAIQKSAVVPIRIAEEAIKKTKKDDKAKEKSGEVKEVQRKIDDRLKSLMQMYADTKDRPSAEDEETK